MTTFSTAQIEMLMSKANFSGTPEEYAQSMGFMIKEITPSTQAARAEVQGKTSIVVISSASAGKLFFTTNKMYCGRDIQWIVAEWNKITQTSRTHYKPILEADDCKVVAFPPQAYVTAEDKEQVEKDLASILAQYKDEKYEIVSKLPRLVRNTLTEIQEGKAATEAAATDSDNDAEEPTAGGSEATES